MPPANSRDEPRGSARRRDSAKRRPNRSLTIPILLLAGGAGFAMLVLLTTVVVLFFVLKPFGTANVTDSTTEAGAPPTKITSPSPPVGPSQRSVEPTTKADDRKWVTEARVEYLHALEEKERRMSATQIRLGSMSRAEFEMGKEAIKQVQANGLDRSPEAMIRSAESVAPETIAALRRERVVNSPEYPELVKNGAYPQYHPTAKREQLYAEFAAATGEKAKWSVVHPFAAFTAKEMDDLMEGVHRLKDGGLGKLTKSQRLLLLKARALDYFESQLPKS